MCHVANCPCQWSQRWCLSRPIATLRSLHEPTTTPRNVFTSHDTSRTCLACTYVIGIDLITIKKRFCTRRTLARGYAIFLLWCAMNLRNDISILHAPEICRIKIFITICLHIWTQYTSGWIRACRGISIKKTTYLCDTAGITWYHPLDIWIHVSLSSTILTSLIRV